MRILLLSQYFPPESGSAAAKMAEMADYLSGRGHQVRVVCQVPNYPAGEVYPGYVGTWFRREHRNGFQITRTWSYATPERVRFWPRFLNYASFMATSLAGIFSGNRPEVILVYSPPLFLGATASLAGRMWGTPFVFWVNDLWPRAAVSLGFMREGPYYQLACEMERLIYRQAAKIFVYSRHMGQEVAKGGADPHKIECHPLWIDTQVFRPDPEGAAAVRQQYGWGDKFVVLYGGNLGLAQGLDILVESALLLRDNPEIIFALVGSGVEKPNLEQRVRDYGLTNVIFIGHQPKEQVGAFFSAADLLFAHLKEAPHRVGTVPEKLLAYMACGRPVLLAAQQGAAADLVKEHGCGFVVSPDNPVFLAQTISSLKGHGQLATRGLKGLEAILADFSGPQVLAAMEASLKAIACQASPTV